MGAAVPIGKPLLDALDRMGQGGLVLNTSGQVLQINATATRLLSEYRSLGGSGSDPEWSREALKTLLRSKGASRFRMDENAWVVVQRDGKRSLILHAVPIDNGAASGPHTVVILVDLAATPRPTAEALQKIFDLTPTEARLAVEIACGKSLEDIAQASHTTLGTVRKQLGSVFAKTDTHRQAELVALLARVSILP
jgi:DNA-binding CsgD family transcriptional regulator